MSDKNLLLKELPFWDKLTDSEQKMISDYSVISEHESGSIIFSADQECPGMIRVISGDVRTYMLSDEGREITLYRMKEGDMDVLSASCVVSQIKFETEIIADTDCKLLILPAMYLSKLKDASIYVRCFVYELLGERFSDVMAAMQRILFTKVDNRIADFLINESKKTGSNIIRTTHEKIATEINSSREVASRILKQFENDGFVELSRGAVKIIDAKKLNFFLQ